MRSVCALSALLARQRKELLVIIRFFKEKSLRTVPSTLLHVCAAHAQFFFVLLDPCRDGNDGTNQHYLRVGARITYLALYMCVYTNSSSDWDRVGGGGAGCFMRSVEGVQCGVLFSSCLVKPKVSQFQIKNEL